MVLSSLQSCAFSFPTFFSSVLFCLIAFLFHLLFPIHLLSFSFFAVTLTVKSSYIRGGPSTQYRPRPVVLIGLGGGSEHYLGPKITINKRNFRNVEKAYKYRKSVVGKRKKKQKTNAKKELVEKAELGRAYLILRLVDYSWVLSSLICQISVDFLLSFFFLRKIGTRTYYYIVPFLKNKRDHEREFYSRKICNIFFLFLFSFLVLSGVV